MAPLGRLFYGDNIDVLAKYVAAESVDLIYLDPPFNSSRSYNVLFKTTGGDESEAQIEAFDDTWHWSPETEAQYRAMIAGAAPPRVQDALQAMYKLLGPNDVLAYIVMMSARLTELHKVLKVTGSLYLHCDPTASHYLKVVLDSIFGAQNFKNEVIWKRTGAHNSAKRWGPVHDVLLFYTKSKDYTWNSVYEPYSGDYVAKFDQEDSRGRFMPISLTGPGVRKGDSGQPWKGVNPTSVGRHWQPSSTAYTVYERLRGEPLAELPMQERLDRMEAAGLIWWPKKTGGTPRFKQYLDDMPGIPVQDIVADIPPIGAQAAERLGYPTQKPVALLERIIRASSNEGDVVLDPFCGCGTSIDAAHRLNRNWVGIDITYLAIDLIRKRLLHSYGTGVESQYEVHGIPTDIAGARALFDENPFDFERWAVSLVDGQPNEKQVGDKGVDGRIRFVADRDGEIGTIIVSVKGGKTVNPAMVRELAGAVNSHRAEMGILIVLSKSTKGMADEANRAGTYEVPLTGHSYPRVQIVSIEDLLANKKPQVPSAILPYIKAVPRPPEAESLF